MSWTELSIDWPVDCSPDYQRLWNNLYYILSQLAHFAKLFLHAISSCILVAPITLKLVSFSLLPKVFITVTLCCLCASSFRYCSANMYCDLPGNGKTASIFALCTSTPVFANSSGPRSTTNNQQERRNSISIDPTELVRVSRTTELESEISVNYRQKFRLSNEEGREYKIRKRLKPNEVFSTVLMRHLREYSMP